MVAVRSLSDRRLSPGLRERPHEKAKRTRSFKSLDAYGESLKHLIAFIFRKEREGMHNTVNHLDESRSIDPLVELDNNERRLLWFRKRRRTCGKNT
jgi:hypothetical protein